MEKYLRHQGTYRIEVPTWSWKSFWPQLLVGLFIGLLLGLLQEPFFGVLGGLIFGLFLGLLMGLLLIWQDRRRLAARINRLNRELSNSRINKDQRRKPNQIIRYSGWSALCGGLVTWLFIWLLFWLVNGLGLGSGLLYSLFFGLVGGLGFGLSFGGLAYLQHYILRFLLLRTGAMPWHYIHFLDYAVERMLLREVGGGYIFMHRLLLDYFASLETKES